VAGDDLVKSESRHSRTNFIKASAGIAHRDPRSAVTALSNGESNEYR
jgi:hypothetical protein